MYNYSRYFDKLRGGVVNLVVGHIDNLRQIEIQSPEVKGALKKVLISPKEGWEGWCMRLFTIQAGGYTPKHTHPWPHINYVVSGQGTLELDNQEYELKAGSFAYVPGGKLHQFRNNSDQDFCFICIVPEEGEA